jgi:hypothetical protein
MDPPQGMFKKEVFCIPKTQAAKLAMDLLCLAQKISIRPMM